MNENSLNFLLDREIPMLIPIEILDDFIEASDSTIREKTRATSLRRCLEGAIKLFYKEKMIADNHVTLKEWNQIDLNGKIDLIGKHYNKGLSIKFHKVRKLGNKGAHFESVVNSNDVDVAISIIDEIVEDLFIKYFEKYKFGTQPPVMTILSSLPPVYRVRILEKLWNNDIDNLNIIDKLSMAYLKNGELKKSLDFLEEIHKKNIIDENYYSNFVYKINTLYESLDKFDISKNILDTTRISNCLIDDKNAKNYPDFIHIFSVLVNGYANIK